MHRRLDLGGVLLAVLIAACIPDVVPDRIATGGAGGGGAAGGGGDGGNAGAGAGGQGANGGSGGEGGIALQELCATPIDDDMSGAPNDLDECICPNFGNDELCMTFEWGVQLGDTQFQELSDMALSPDGTRIYAVGAFEGVVTVGDQSVEEFSGGDSLFLAAYSTSGEPLFVRKVADAGNDGTFNDADFDNPTRIAVLDNGDVILAGAFEGNVTLGGTLYDASNWDGFIMALDPDGAPKWHRVLTSVNNAWLRDVASDGDDIVVVGRYSANLTIAPAPLAVDCQGFPPALGDEDWVIAKLNSSGDYLWCNWVAGTGDDEAHGVAFGPNGNIYAVGHASSGATYQGAPIAAGLAEDGVLLALDGNGSLRWHYRAVDGPGSSGEEQLFEDLVVDGDDLYVIGGFWDDVQFPAAQGGPMTILHDGSADQFVAKLSDGSQLVEWARDLSGIGEDAARVIAYDAVKDDLWVAGWIEGPWVPYPGKPPIVPLDAEEAYAIRLSAADGSTRWGRSFPGINDQEILGIVIDPQGRVAMGGNNEGTFEYGGGIPTPTGVDAMILFSLSE